MKKYLILLLPLLVLFGCKRDLIIIEGSVINKSQKYLYISKVDINIPVLIDSSKIDSKGSFRFKIKATEPDFYQIGYSNVNFANLLAEPGERITIDFNSSNLFENYTVMGSKGSEQMQMLDLKLLETKKKLDSLSILYEKASTEPAFETKSALLEQAYLELINEQRKFNIAFIINNLSSLASIKALYQQIDDETYVLYNTRDLQYLKIVSDSLKHYYPDSKHTKALISNFEKEMSQFVSRELQMTANSLPETKLDPELMDINGRKITLSSLRGKYVLLAFWSAESRDCIADNLQLKEFYKIYNRMGFEIYQINLDKDESVWRNAVRFDELPWISTREDDPSNPKNVRLYNVKSLPANYLYDPEGNIIASNLHGRNLQIKLNQIFSN
jgi:thiol-disulfide isomerase/thioredoxin